MRIHRYSLPIILTGLLFACAEQKEYESYEDYPSPVDANLWTEYSVDRTKFKLWSPTAEEVKIHLFENGDEGEPLTTRELDPDENGIWSVQIDGDLNGTYYTFQVKANGIWMEETPGIYAQAVGVNGKRAMIIDLDQTNPEGWEQDKGPVLDKPNDAIIYEMHVRDITIHPSSGSSIPGKFLGLVEEGTTSPEGLATGIDHLTEMGITHVHLLPSFDNYSIDESRLDSAQFNWGYDPQNYNVPEGSFSTDPYNGEVRIKEFKQMVKSFHDKGIGVILDVVYNHTGRTENSNFNLEAPGYYYRFREDGSYSDAAACGNETASDRAMVRKFILESVKYWAEEYHLDGFRFDLMGIHDISTMNEIARELKKINPNIMVYGEGWTAGDSPLPFEQRALKMNITQMPQITAFSDDIRDGLKGSVFDIENKGFVNGAENMEESVKFGVVGSIQHPQIDYTAVNYSNDPWTNEPWQAISYVSCHDNHTLFDKLSLSRPDLDEENIVKMHMLANAVVLTSQGVPFLHAGVEMLRTKQGEENSFNLPDSINQIDWSRKSQYQEIVNYYKNLISLRKDHPAFRISNSSDIRDHLQFRTVENGLVSYVIDGKPLGDSWDKIYVIYNARQEEIIYPMEGNWSVAVLSDRFINEEFKAGESLKIPPISMAILYQKP